MTKLGTNEFAEAFGVAESSLPESVCKMIAEYALEYRQLDAAESDKVAKEVSDKIAANTFTQVGEHRHNIWELAWKEARDKFEASGYSLDALDPNFIGASKYVRLNGDYVEGVTEKFELLYFRIFREWLAETYLKQFDNIYEFGCGSGFNLGALGAKFPEKNLMGFDWAAPAVEILHLMAEKKKFKLGGRRFDFFNPDFDVAIPANTAVLTFCAFEQIGDRHGDMLKYFLENKPALVLQMEPTIDYYDPAKPADALAIKYHQLRKYLSGYLPALKKLEAEKKIEIIKSKRMGFGSLYNECYTMHIWRPL